MNVEFGDFETAFGYYATATDLNAATEEKKVGTLMSIIGRPAQKIAERNFTFNTTDNQKTMENLLKSFREHFAPQRNQLVMRHRLLSRRQLCTESISEFNTSLRDLAAYCDLDKITPDILLRDIFICGVSDIELKQQLLQLDSATATLTAVVKTATAYESAKSGEKELSSAISASVNAVQKRHSRKFNGNSSDKEGKVKNSKMIHDCRFCGQSHEIRKCPAFGKTCAKCKKKNHFAVVCKQFKRVQNVDIDEECDSATSEEYVFHVHDTSNSKQDKWTADIEVGSVKPKIISFKIDTGSTVTVLPEGIVHPKLIRQSNTVLRGAFSSPLKSQGVCQLQLKYKDKKHMAKVYIVPNSPILLGADASEKLGLVQRTYKVDKLGHVNRTPVEITVDPEAKPSKLSRRIPVSLREEVKAEIDKLLAEDIIEPVDIGVEPLEECWISPLVCARKKNKALRLCLDLRKLNESVARPCSLIPTAEELYASIGNQGVFSKLDAKAGFHQFLLSEKSRKLFNFCTPWGMYRYKRLPFGVNAAPEIFQEQMTKFFEGLPGVKVYFDDILVYGKDKEEHDQNMKRLKARAVEVGLQFNESKCEYAKNSLNYLGHSLSKSGLRPDAEKCRAINGFPQPKSIKDCQRFVGMVTYLARYIKDLSSLTAPIRAVMEKAEFDWTPEAEGAFQKLKHLLSSASVLKLFDAKHETAVYADASKFGLGAILVQKDPDTSKWKPVQYASRTMTKTQQHYSQMEKEALAITFALARFRTYLLGIKFTVYTDHKPLPYILRKPLEDCPPRILRFVLAMSPYNFDLIYKPGKEMVVPDAFSRAPIPDLDVEQEHLTEAYVNFIIDTFPISITEIAAQTMKNPDLYRVLSKNPKVSDPESIKLITEKQNLSRLYTECGDVICKGERIYIPIGLRRQILTLAHIGHPGYAKMREILSTTVFWPGMNQDCETFCKLCKSCLITSDLSPPQPLRDVPFYNIWECISADIFTFEGQQFLSIIDYRSRWPEVFIMGNKQHACITARVIERITECFARFGLPKYFMSDSGSQFLSRQMVSYLNGLGITIKTSCPYHQSENGRIERFHRTIKKKLKATTNGSLHARLQTVLFTIRNSVSRMTGVSPMSKMIQFTPKGFLPQIPREMKPTKVEQNSQQRMISDFNARHRVKVQSYLPPATPVIVKKKPDDTAYEPGYQTMSQSGSKVVLKKDGHERTIVRDRRFVKEIDSDIQREAKRDTGGNGLSENLVLPSRSPPKTSSPKEVDPSAVRPTVTTRSGRHVRAPSRLNL